MKPLRLFPSERIAWRRAARWGAAAAGVLALPKCIACVATYLALAGAAGVELCGAPASDSLLLAPAVTISGLAAALVLRKRNCIHHKGTKDTKNGLERV